MRVLHDVLIVLFYNGTDSLLHTKAQERKELIVEWHSHAHVFDGYLYMVNNRFHQFSSSCVAITSNEKGISHGRTLWQINRLILQWGRWLHRVVRRSRVFALPARTEEVSHRCRFDLHLMRGSRSHQVISSHHEPSTGSCRARDLYPLSPRPWPLQPVEKFRKRRL